MLISGIIPLLANGWASIWGGGGGGLKPGVFNVGFHGSIFSCYFIALTLL